APRRQQDHRVQRTWRHGSRDADYQWTAVNRLMKFEGPYAPRVKAGCWRMHARGTARRSLWSFAPVLATDQRSLVSAVPPIVLQNYFSHPSTQACFKIKGECATSIQELVRSDSIVAYFYSTASPR